MLLNADFSRHVIVTPDEHQWVASPQAGVERVMLDRIGGEKARAASIVRYAYGSHFPPHLHPGGEEILVLSGSFSEADDHYPAGWYLRNPPGSGHQPSSSEGATIFVKLRQMRPEETRPVRMNTREPSAWQRLGDRDVCTMYSDANEQVCLQRLDPGTTLLSEPVLGAEMLVLDGELTYGERSCECGTWIRLPEGSHPELTAGPRGATIYLKTGLQIGVAPEE